MPYIKKEEREKFDNIIEQVKKDQHGVAGAMLLEVIEDLHPTQVSGSLNYLFSKLLMDEKHPPYTYRTFILGILSEVYANPPKYYKLQDAVGLLTCMIEEFKRRGWSPGGRVSLKYCLQRFLVNIVFPYEDGKIQSNGDL